MIPKSMERLREMDSDAFLAMPTETLAGLPEVVRWTMLRTFMIHMEVPTSYARAQLPASLRPMEVRPGVSLFAVMANVLFDGNTETPISNVPFYEAMSFFLVHADLSMEMPLPSFAFFTRRILSDEPAFVHNERKKLRLDIRLAPGLRAENLDDGGVHMRDDAGEIADLHPSGGFVPKELDFAWKHYWIQYYTPRPGGLVRGLCSFSAYAYEHQRVGAHGRIHTDHPLFADWPGVGEVMGDVYMQYMTPPDVLSKERFWGVEELDG